MKKMIGVVAVAAAALLSGCGTTGKFVYPANMTTLYRVSEDSFSSKTVAVLPFDDYRADENSNWFMTYLLPVFPFGWCDYERPDAADMFPSLWAYDITPSEDLAKATAVSIRQSRMFKDSFFTMGGEKNNADFVFSGVIKEMRYNGKMISYGVSVFCPFLWTVGFPAAVSDNVLSIEFTLRDKSGKIVWEYSASRSNSIVQWLYYRMGHDCKAFAQMYQQTMNDALSSLSSTMRANPELFK